MIGAIILAAGESTRMGTQKLLLPYAGSTVIETIVDRVLRSRVDACVVVTGHDAERIRDALGARDVLFAQNDRYRDGMLSSVRAGLAASDESWKAALIVLGDQPSLRAETINLLIERNSIAPEDIVVPAFEGRRGHPLLVAMRFREEMMTDFDGIGLRGLLRAHPESVVEIAVGTSTILDDMDYPEDYQRAIDALERAEGG